MIACGLAMMRSIINHSNQATSKNLIRSVFPWRSPPTVYPATAAAAAATTNKGKGKQSPVGRAAYRARHPGKRRWLRIFTCSPLSDRDGRRPMGPRAKGVTDALFTFVRRKRCHHGGEWACA